MTEFNTKRKPSKKVGVVQKATKEEKEQYKGLYPLYGFVTLAEWDSETLHLAIVEDLRGEWSKPDPIFEILAPRGFGFEMDDLHALLCHSLTDVRERSREPLWQHSCECLSCN